MKKNIVISLLMISMMVPAFVLAQEDTDTTVSTSSCLSLSNTLRYKSRDANTNDEVSALQDFLQSQGYLSSGTTGYYGLQTTQAVKAFQKANGINPVGYVGSITRAKIQTISCSGDTTALPFLDTSVDPSIKANLSNARAQAAIYYDAHKSYTGVCTNEGGIGAMILQSARNLNPNNTVGGITTSFSYSATGGSGSAVCHDSANFWAAIASLKNTSTGWCVDSTGVSRRASSLDANAISCPSENSVSDTSSCPLAIDKDGRWLHVCSPETLVPTAPLKPIKVCGPGVLYSTENGKLCKQDNLSPTLDFSVSPENVTSGGYATLTWSSKNTTSCMASSTNPNGPNWGGVRATSGSESIGPLTAKTNYTYGFSIDCYGSNGQTVNKNLGVTAGSNPPVITLSAYPESISQGGSSTLSWSSSAEANCTSNFAPTNPTMWYSGTYIVSPTSTKTYTLHCDAVGGSVDKSVTVTVLPVYPVCSSAGYDTTTGFRCGCTSTFGYSTTDGHSCGIVTPGAPALKILFPAGGETLYQGQTYNTTWSGSERPDVRSYNVSLTYNTSSNTGIETKLGTTYKTDKDVNTFTWTVPAGITPGSNYTLTLSSNAEGATSKMFTIAGTCPAGGFDSVTGSPCGIPIPATVDMKINGSDGPVTIANGQGMSGSWTTTGVGGCVSYKDGQQLSGVDSGTGSFSTIYPGHPFYPTNPQTVFSVVCKKMIGLNPVGDTVSDSVTVNLTTSTPTSTLLGDVNLDGSVNVIDAQQIARYVAGLTTLSAQQMQNADVDKDGKVTSTDSSLIAQYTLGNITTFPLLGDANLDGLINVIDAQQVSRYIAGKTQLTPTQLLTADVNRDGQVNSTDLDLISQYSVGNITKFP